MAIERWQPVNKYPGYYVSNYGRVRHYNALLKLTCNNRGYLVVGLRNEQGRKLHYIHRLVALAFLPPDPTRPFVNHKDTNKSNCHVSNLEWSTQAENVRHAQLAGLGEQRKPVYIVETGDIFDSQYACARALGISDHRVSEALSDRNGGTGRLLGYTIQRISERYTVPQNEEVVIEDAEIAFRNFTGREGMYSREGERSFVVILPTDIADELVKTGWNIKTLKAREEGDEPRPYVQIAVSYKNRPPNVVLITSRGRTVLDEDALDALDNIDIRTADVIIRPYDWKLASGASGRKAYLGSLYITVNENPLELKYGMTPATVAGPMMEKTGPYVPSEEATH